jgi:NADPH:quinone reductase-like Zn-dependent oxidoreductase
MKAIILKGPNDWELAEIPKPVPAKGQVLVKMAFAPINPSDLAFLTGNYGLKKAFPVVPGLEGSGVVVESGGGFMANRLLNKNVACTAPNTGNGTWAEYMLTDVNKCMDLSKNVSLEQGSMLFVNPLTALSFAKKAKKMKADLIVFSAAGSALGHMVTHFANEIDIPVFGLIRKENLKDETLKKGFTKVFCTENSEYLKELNLASKSYKKVIFFDAVGGGSIPYQILNALPDNTRMVIYGRLDQNPSDFSPQNILFKQNTVEGYWLSKEAQKKSIVEVILDVRKIQKMLSKGFETQVQKKVKLAELQTGLETYVKGMSAGKVLIDCHFDSAP